MKELVINGGKPISGNIQPSGNSNLAVILIAASLLTDKRTILHNVPNTRRVQSILNTAKQLGAYLEQDEHGNVSLHSKRIQEYKIDLNMINSSWYSFLFLAPLLLQEGKALLEIDFPIARISTLLQMLRDFDIDITTEGNLIKFSRNDRFSVRTKHIWLEEASVSTTALCLMLASKIPIVTTIKNAASEPHIQDMCVFLQRMGVSIQGIGSNILSVIGTNNLAGTEFSISTDHVEAANWIGVAAMTQGSVSIHMPEHDRMALILRNFDVLGVKTRIDDGGILYTPSDLIIRDDFYGTSMKEIKTAPWPGFPSDLSALIATMATQSQGSVLVHEALYNNRMNFVDQLRFMGANMILCDPHRVIVTGPSRFYPSQIETPDVRVGFALVSAALTAKGRSIIGFPEQLDRVFENVVPKLQSLGADVELIN